MHVKMRKSQSITSKMKCKTATVSGNNYICSVFGKYLKSDDRIFAIIKNKNFSQ